MQCSPRLLSAVRVSGTAKYTACALQLVKCRAVKLHFTLTGRNFRFRDACTKSAASLCSEPEAVPIVRER